MHQYVGNVSLYDVFNYLSGIVLFAYVFLLSGKYKKALRLNEKPRGTLLTFIQLEAICLLFFALFSFFNPEFAKWFTRGNANYFGNLISWVIAVTIVTLVFRVSTLRALDVLTIVLPLSLFVAKFACFFHGCCWGIELPGSWYVNQIFMTPQFPIQLLEAIVALALFFVLRFYSKKKKVVGTVFPLYLCLYGISRFITEFFRGDLPNVLGPFDAYQILSVVFALSGIIAFLVLKKYGKKADSKAKKQ